MNSLKIYSRDRAFIPGISGVPGISCEPPTHHLKLVKKNIIILGSWGCQWQDIQSEMCVVQVGVREKEKRNAVHKAALGSKLLIRELVKWLSHCINDIWIEMETFQPFDKQLGTFLYPLGFSLTHLLIPQMIDIWGMGAVTVSFFAFLGSFSSFLPHKGEK